MAKNISLLIVLGSTIISAHSMQVIQQSLPAIERTFPQLAPLLYQAATLNRAVKPLQPQPHSSLTAQSLLSHLPAGTPQLRAFSTSTLQHMTHNEARNILNVQPSATTSEIKAAYIQQMKKYHPDANADKATATKKAQEINEAFRILSSINTSYSHTSQKHNSQSTSNWSDAFNHDFKKSFSFWTEKWWLENHGFSAAEIDSILEQLQKYNSVTSAEKLIRAYYAFGSKYTPRTKETVVKSLKNIAPALDISKTTLNSLIQVLQKSADCSYKVAYKWTEERWLRQIGLTEKQAQDILYQIAHDNSIQATQKLITSAMQGTLWFIPSKKDMLSALLDLSPTLPLYSSELSSALQELHAQYISKNSLVQEFWLKELGLSTKQAQELLYTLARYNSIGAARAVIKAYCQYYDNPKKPEYAARLHLFISEATEGAFSPDQIIKIRDDEYTKYHNKLRMKRWLWGTGAVAAGAYLWKKQQDAHYQSIARWATVEKRWITSSLKLSSEEAEAIIYDLAKNNSIDAAKKLIQAYYDYHNEYTRKEPLIAAFKSIAPSLIDHPELEQFINELQHNATANNARAEHAWLGRNGLTHNQAIAVIYDLAKNNSADAALMLYKGFLKVYEHPSQHAIDSFNRSLKRIAPTLSLTFKDLKELDHHQRALIASKRSPRVDIPRNFSLNVVSSQTKKNILFGAAAASAALVAAVLAYNS